MNCPTCGVELHSVSVVGLDNSLRCGTCGGLRIEGWVINKIAEGGDIQLTPMAKGIDLTSENKPLLCPEDGNNLSRPDNNELPPDIGVWQCAKCKWWWVPGDAIFDIKLAFEVKREYLKRWSKRSSVSSFILPVVLTLVLMVGLSVSILAVRQQTSVPASAAGVSSVSVVYRNDGSAEVRFKSAGDFAYVSYKRQNDKDWQQAEVFSQGDWKLVVINGVKMGENIWLSFGIQVKKIIIGQTE